MDRARNPYTPNAGAPPRYLAGRRAEVDDFRVLLQRLQRGYTEQSLIVTGLRGVGKTVLLGQYRAVAEQEGWVVVEAEVTKATPFGRQIAALARRALLQVSPRTRWGERARGAADVVKAFSLTVQPDGSLAAGLDVEPEHGRADTGNLTDDLPDVFQALGEAAQERGRGVVFLLDEVQFLGRADLEALIGAVHRTVQRQLPGLAGEAKSYAERLFTFPVIGELPPVAAAEALVEPALAEGVRYELAAVDHVVAYTEGYPCFLQELGRAAWSAAQGDVITASDVREAQDVVEAELGPQAHKAADVAGTLGRTSEQVAPLRARLISKGLLYAPRYGYAKFTVPRFDRFLRRHMPLATP